MCLNNDMDLGDLIIDPASAVMGYFCIVTMKDTVSPCSYVKVAFSSVQFSCSVVSDSL